MPATATPTRSPLLTESLCRDDAAAYIGFKPSTLAAWAHDGKHRDELPFTMIGKKAFYKISSLDAFIAARFAEATTR